MIEEAKYSEDNIRRPAEPRNKALRLNFEIVSMIPFLQTMSKECYILCCCWPLTEVVDARVSLLPVHRKLVLVVGVVI